MNNNINIIIADDMEPILIYFDKVISSVPEFNIVGKAANGKELVELVKKHNPDLVITDVEMPECSGIQAIEELNKLNIKTKYIVVTGSALTIINNKAELGIAKTISKPIIDDEKFIQEVKDVINAKVDENILTENKVEEKAIIKCENANIKKENIFIRIIKKILRSK